MKTWNFLKSPQTRFAGLPALLGSLAVMFMMSGCQTPSQKFLPEANLAGPGWEITRGQAMWKPGRNKKEYVGDFVAGYNPGGDSSYAEFNKALVPVLKARTIGSSWQLHFLGTRATKKGSQGLNPKWIWPYVPRLLQPGARPPEGWELERAQDHITLKNPDSGEVLELYPFRTNI